MKQDAGILQEDSLLMRISAGRGSWRRVASVLKEHRLRFLWLMFKKTFSLKGSSRASLPFAPNTHEKISQEAQFAKRQVTQPAQKQEKLAKWVEESPKISRSWVRNLRVSSWQRRKIPCSSWELGEGTAKLLRCFILFWKVQTSTLSPTTFFKKKNEINQKYEQRPQENWEITNMKIIDLLDWVWEVFLSLFKCWGNSLVVQWLRLCAVIAMAWVQSLVRKLRSHKSHSTAKHIYIYI